MNHFIKEKKNKPKNRVFALFLLLGVVCSHTIPIFATDPSSYEFNEVTLGITFTVGDNAIPMYTESGDIKVPLYLYYTGTTDRKYMNGYVTINKPNFTFKVNGNVLAYSSFEPDLSDGIQFVFPNESTTRCHIYFDDHFTVNGGGFSHIIGYFHFSVNNTGSYSIEPNFSTLNASIISQKVYCGSSPYGLVDAITHAIVSAYDANDIFDILDNIGTNSGYLPYIFTNLQQNHTALYALIENMWHTDQAILSVNQDTYRTVLSILAILQSQYGENESEAESQVEAIDDELGQLELDMNVAKPSAVANIADEYVNQIDTTYNSNVFGFLNFPTIILLMCIVMAFAIISYMLYGGQ